MSLLLNPVVWGHHYLTAAPIIIWAVTQSFHSRRTCIGIAATLMKVWPSFDVFPLSFSRLAGLIVLLWGDVAYPIEECPPPAS